MRYLLLLLLISSCYTDRRVVNCNHYPETEPEVNVRGWLKHLPGYHRGCDPVCDPGFDRGWILNWYDSANPLLHLDLSLDTSFVSSYWEWPLDTTTATGGKLK